MYDAPYCVPAGRTAAGKHFCTGAYENGKVAYIAGLPVMPDSKRHNIEGLYLVIEISTSVQAKSEWHVTGRAATARGTIRPDFPRQ